MKNNKYLFLVNLKKYWKYTIIIPFVISGCFLIFTPNPSPTFKAAMLIIMISSIIIILWKEKLDKNSL